MKIGESIKQIFNPAFWTDAAFVEKHLPDVYYVGAGNNHSYSFTDPGFSIVETANRLMDRSLNYSGTCDHNYIELFHCIPEIFAPIHAYASRIANADFQLRKNRNDQVVYDNENWNRLFNTPNPLQHFRELMYEAVVYEMVTGNTMMYFNTPSTLNQDYTNIQTIWNLPSDQITIELKKPLKLYQSTTIEDIIATYKLDDRNKFDPINVLHIRGTNIKWDKDMFTGRSPLESASKAIANLIAVYEARNVIYTKRGALGAMVSEKTDESGKVPLTDYERKELHKDFQASYGLSHGKSPVALTSMPVRFERFGMSITELQPFEETLADAAAIYGALGVPFELAPKLKGETFSNQENAERSFYQNSVIPKANMYMQSLTNKLGLNEAKLYLHASFEHVDVLQENKKEKAAVDKQNGDTYMQRFLTGVAPLNDWIVANGNDKVSGPLYEKRLLEMTPEELEQVKSVLSLKTVSNGTNTGAEGSGTEAEN